MSIKNILIAVVLITAAYIYTTYVSNRPTQLVTDFSISSDRNGKSVQVLFASPTRYLGHFPDKQGEVLQIKVRAIAFSDFTENFSLVDRYIKQSFGIENFIEDARYEGDVVGGPFIVVKFTQPVEFTVNESDGLRGLMINYKII